MASMQASTSSSSRAHAALGRRGQRGCVPAALGRRGQRGVQSLAIGRCSQRGCVRPVRAAAATPPPARASIVSHDTLPEEFSEAQGYELSFVAFSRLAPERKVEELTPLLPAHEDWLRSLGDRLVLHGPFLNAEAAYYGSEMYAVRADSAATARQLVETDPLHSEGIRRFELMSWVQQTRW